MTNAEDDALARRSRLLAAKLSALVRDHLGESDGFDLATGADVFPNGAATLHDGHAWILVEGPASRSLGPAIAWSLRRGSAAIDLVVDSDAGLLARRAEGFDFPISVWFADERTLLPAIAEPVVEPPVPAPAHLDLRPLIDEAGADPLVEHGVVVGEVRGLEVCRVVDEPTTGLFAEMSDVVGASSAMPDVDAIDERIARRERRGVILEVGVGANDREAFQLLHGDVPTVEALREVVARVAEHRARSAPHHPLNRLARERLLRWEALHDPTRVGFIELAVAEPPVPRPNVRDPAPCVATGRREDRTAAIVVFSSGVDLDLIPFVADLQARRHDPVVIALPERDILPIVERMNDLLLQPADIVGLA